MNSAGSVVMASVVALAVFGVLQYLHIDAGSLTDWTVGLICFWWLVIITTFPWNMHFRAKEILHEAVLSKEKNITVREEDVVYAESISKRYLTIALGLHLISAIVFYGMAYTGITPIGYIGAIAALLLTLLRPAIRMHDYIISRLTNIGQQFSYPREDVATLQERVRQLEYYVENIQHSLNIEEPSSWAASQQAHLEILESKLTDFYTSLDKLKMQNQAEHERLARRAEEAIAALSEDATFLNQVRELIRFIKSA